MSSLTSNDNETFDLKLNDYVTISSPNMALADGATIDEIKKSDVGNPISLACFETINFDNMDKSEIKSSVNQTCTEGNTFGKTIKCETKISVNKSCEDGIITQEVNALKSSTNMAADKMVKSETQGSVNAIQGEDTFIAERSINSSKKSATNNFGTCPLCSLGLQRRTSYCNHILTHLGALPFYCEVCYSYFITELQLQHHMLKHTNEALYVTTKTTVFRCNICDISYPFFNNLAEHYLIHIIQMPFICKRCNLYFAEELDYIIHQHLHSWELKCTICNAIFLNKKDKLQHVISHQPLKYFRKVQYGPGFRRTKQIGQLEEENNVQSTNAVCQLDPLSSSVPVVTESSSKLAALLGEKTSNASNDKSNSNLNINNQKLHNACTDLLVNNTSVEESPLVDISEMCEVVLHEDSSNSIPDLRNKISKYHMGASEENNPISNAYGNSIHYNNFGNKIKMIDKYKYLQMQHKILNNTTSSLENSSSLVLSNVKSEVISPSISAPSVWNFNPTHQIKNIEKQVNKHLNESVTLSNGNTTLPLSTVNNHNQPNNPILNESVRSLPEDFNITNKKSKKKKTRKSNSQKKSKKLKNVQSFHEKFKLKKCLIVLQKLPLHVQDYHTYQMFIESLKFNYNNHEIIPQEKYEKYLMKLNTKFCDDISVKDTLKYISGLKEMHKKSLNFDKELKFALCELSKLIYDKYRKKSPNCIENSKNSDQSNFKLENEQFQFGETANKSKKTDFGIVSIKKRIQIIKSSLARTSHSKKEQNINGPSVVLYRLPQYIYDTYRKQKPIMLPNVLPIICAVQSLQ